MRRTAVVLVLATALACALVGGPAWADPPPTPPPNPSDSQLSAGHDVVTQRSAQVAALTGQLSALDDQVAALQMQLAARQEQSNRAQVDLQNARSAAAAAAAAAEQARAATTAASSAVSALQGRVDEFVTVRYQQGLDLGPLGLLTAPGGPQAVLDRAAFADVVADEQQQALEGLQRAVIEKANADSLARQAQDRARAQAAAAQRASDTAAALVAQVRAQAQQQAAALAQVQARRDEVNRALTQAVANDATLRTQRARYLDWQAAQQAAEQARQLAAQRAAAAQVAGQGVVRGAGGVRTVIDRAMAQLGVQYAWGGGNSRGPTLGVRDGGVADAFGDYRRVGFDCSGLMIYAFAGAGVSLPHYSGYQYTAGQQVPLGARQPGDMLFYDEGGEIGHVALYVGNGMMIEAPYSGASVRLVPMRFGGLMPYVTRMV